MSPDGHDTSRGVGREAEPVPTSPGRERLLRELIEKERRVSHQRLPITREERDDGEYPLSFAQERLWFLHRLDPSNAAYHLVIRVPFAASVDPEALDVALQALVARHEVLRTVFPDREGQPVQVIGASEGLRFPVSDLSAVPTAQREAALRRLLGEVAAAPFDLSSDAPLRARRIQLAEDSHVMVFVVHHVVADGWSLGILMRDFLVLYHGARSGAADPLPPLPVRYADFARWQRARLRSPQGAGLLAYWRRQLEGAVPLALPSERPRPAHPSGKGAAAAVTLSKELTAGLRELSRAEGATLFMTLLAGFVAILSRLSGQTDVVVGSPITSHRERPELSQVMGCFLNMLVLRVDAGGSPSFRELLTRVQRVARDGYANQELPFEEIVRELRTGRSGSQNPLFQVTFALDQPYPSAKGIIDDVSLAAAMGVDLGTSRFDLEANAAVVGEEMILSFTYAAELFEPRTVQRWVEQFRDLLQAVAANPSLQLGELPLTSESLLSTPELLSHIRSLGIRPRVEGDRLRLSAPPGAMSDGLRNELARRKDEIVALLQSATATGAAAPIPTIPRSGDLPVSLAQQRLWFLDQLGPGSAAYNIAGAIRMAHYIDVDALGRALDALLERHESLRSTFPTRDGEPRLLIHPPGKGALEIVDLQHLPREEREEELARVVADRARRPFDLARGPLIHVCMTRLSASDCVLSFCMHHIISDGWSLEVFGKELSALYTSLATGQPDALPALPVQFADFAAWQRERLESHAVADQLAYWKSQLGNSLPVIELPTDRPRPPVQTLAGARSRMKLPSELANGLKKLSREEGATLFMTLLAAFKVLLYRYTGQTDLVVGTPTAGRGRPELENLIGFFVNNLVIRTNVAGRPTFRDFLHQTRRILLKAHANQDVPFDQLVEVLRPERTVSHPPLFQVMFNSPTVPVVSFDQPGEGLSTLEFQVGTSRFDLTVDVFEHLAKETSQAWSPGTASGITMIFEYNTDLFDEETILGLQRSFARLLEGVVENPGGDVSLLPLITDAERNELVVEWNDTGADYPREACIHHLFEEQARRRPRSTAVVAGGESLTYDELERRSRTLALRLRGVGVGPEVLVGVCVDRSVGMLVAVLGVLRAGGAYVPMDPGYPKERLRFMLEDSGAAVLLTQSHLRDVVPAGDVRVVHVDDEAAEGAADEALDGTRGAAPDNLAYVIYTSGSTGKPKGVQVTHGSVVNFLTSMALRPGMDADDSLLAVTTLSFDIAGLELYLPLALGARVTIASGADAMDPTRLAGLIEASGATVMQATPATWRMLVQSGWRGRSELKMLCGGEALERELAEQLRPLGASLWNLYGPTEATIWSSVLQVEDTLQGPLSIGRPIANTQMLILDEHRNPVPVGVAGELYIGGDGLARGYLNRPELTAERFVTHPLATGSSARLYRTGDSARFRRDGAVEFLGRLDSQVKMRGFRIELGEIESTLNEAADVLESVVAVREDVSGDQRLVAYVVAKDGRELDPGALQAGLRNHLPNYMVPSTFVILASLPLTPNGKVDRRALPAPEGASVARAASYMAPTNATERIIAEAWQEVLRVERVGLTENFFDLGGHSLLAVRVHSSLSRRLERPPALIDLFQYPTVASLASYVSRGGPDDASLDGALAHAARQLEA